MNLMVARTLSFLELFAAEKRPLSSGDIARMLHLPASSCHDQTIVSAALLREEVAAGNERGWFLSAEESEPDLTTLSGRFTWGGAAYIVTSPRYCSSDCSLVAAPFTASASTSRDSAPILA